MRILASMRGLLIQVSKLDLQWRMRVMDRCAANEQADDNKG